MKKEILFAVLAAGCIANPSLCEEIEQPSEQKDDLVASEKKPLDPRVLDAGIHTELNGNSLYDIMLHSKGTEKDAKTVLVKYDKHRRLERTGYLKRLVRYPKAREHIERGNAVLCFNAVKERDPRDDFDRELTVILYKTQDIRNCAKVAEWHERLKNERRYRGGQC